MEGIAGQFSVSSSAWFWLQGDGGYIALFTLCILYAGSSLMFSSAVHPWCKFSFILRFADDVDDLFGGTSTLGRPGAGGGGRQRSISQVVGPSDGNKSTGRTHGDVKGQGDDEGDWLSLAIGKSNERKAAEKKETLNISGKKEEAIVQETQQENETKNTVTDQRKGILREESKEDSAKENKRPKEAENPRAASAGDYLGLGDDIDLDTLLS